MELLILHVEVVVIVLIILGLNGNQTQTTGERISLLKKTKAFLMMWICLSIGLIGRFVFQNEIMVGFGISSGIGFLVLMFYFMNQNHKLIDSSPKEFAESK